MPDLLTHKPPPALKESPTYRAYRLSRNGSIDSAEIIRAESDDEARALARAMVNGHGIELWERARLLDRFPPLAT